MNDEKPPPPLPKGLTAAGRALWRAVVGDYDLDAAELVILTAACRQADDVALLEATIADNGATVTGSQGQPRLNAALTEVRQGRIALAKLLAELRLPSDEDEGAGRSPAAVRARAAAQVRWAGHNRRRAADEAAEQGATHG